MTGPLAAKGVPIAAAPVTPSTGALPPADERAATLRVRPGAEPGPARLHAPDGQTRLDLDGTTLLLPGRPARLTTVPIAGRQLLAAGVVLPSGQILAVLAGWDGSVIRILAVESWEWRGSGPRTLGLRIVAVPDDRRLLLLYQATLITTPHPGAAGGPVKRNEAWTDVLAWQDGLRTEPLRAVLPGTWQARMAATRARVSVLLVPPRTVITAAELMPTGLLDPLGVASPDSTSTAH